MTPPTTATPAVTADVRDRIPRRRSTHSVALARVFRAAERWWAVARWHRPAQLARRLWYIAVRPRLRRLRPVPMLGVAPPPRDFGDAPPPQPAFSCHPTVNSADDLAAGQVELLHDRRYLGRPLDWRAADDDAVPRLWRFQLHYHEFLAELVADPSTPTDDDARGLVWESLAGWLRAHPAENRRGDAWHPYVIARRIPIWANLLRRRPPEPLAIELRRSLAEQAYWLHANLEYDLGGNHLWDDARALAIAGCYFAGPTADRWRRAGVELLDRCVAEQVLPSGEHFERSPMYQADLARGLEEAADWMHTVDAPTAARWRSVAERMTAFLAAIRHPDGGIPLFGDSVLDHDAPRPPSTVTGWVGDYWVQGDGQNKLIFDAGAVGPDHLPAHAHADLCGFEASVFGRRLFVDAGVGCYAGRERHGWRRTAAHNLLQIDGRECADAYGSFRLGRRGRVLRRGDGVADTGVYAWAVHDGYRAAGVPETLRLWFVARDPALAWGPWFSVQLGRATDGNLHRWTDRVRLHPNWSLRSLDARALVAVDDSEAVVRWEAVGDGTLRRFDVRLAERFGDRTPAVGLAWSGVGPTPFSVWVLSPGDAGAAPTSTFADGVLTLGWQSADGRKTFSLVGTGSQL
ncbi:MAG: heparinase II/III domain-containing protein [Planctomycetia bacterium]